jgi:hypothetical protein
MRATQLKRILLFRKILNKEVDHYTEVETNILIGIYIMNIEHKRCSGNTLFNYLSKINRTPYKKKLLLTIRKFKQEEMIRTFGKGAGTNILLTLEAKLILFRLEEKMRSVRFNG